MTANLFEISPNWISFSLYCQTRILAVCVPWTFNITQIIIGINMTRHILCCIRKADVSVCWRYMNPLTAWIDDVICPPNGRHGLYPKWETYCNCTKGIQKGCTINNYRKFLLKRYTNNKTTIIKFRSVDSDSVTIVISGTINIIVNSLRTDKQKMRNFWSEWCERNDHWVMSVISLKSSFMKHPHVQNAMSKKKKFKNYYNDAF